MPSHVKWVIACIMYCHAVLVHVKTTQILHVLQQPASVSILDLLLSTPHITHPLCYHPALQIHGGAGVTDVTPLAHTWAGIRTLRLADGPDVVHLETIAKLELRQGARRARL